MRSKHWVSLALPLTLALSFNAIAENWTGKVHFMLGPKKGDKDLDLTSFGAAVSFGQVGWPVMLALDVVLSQGDGSGSYSYTGYYYYYYYDVDVDVKTQELAFGVRKFWGEKVRPFIGGGIELFQSQIEVKEPGFPSVDDDDADLGLWANAGIYWEIGDKFDLGLHVRYSDAEPTFSDEFTGSDLDFSGFHYGVLAGWHW